MDDFTTSLMAQINRAAEAVVDNIAKDGLSVLKSTLDKAGFGEYESLKSYEIFAHVSEDLVTFEIQVEFDSLDDESKKKVVDQAPDTKDKDIRRAARTYAISGAGGMTRRLEHRRDGRTPARDARQRVHDIRRPTRRVGDIRKGTEGRLAEHEFAMRAPRGLSITKEGKLSIALERTIEETERGVRFPQGNFQGIIGQFLTKLQSTIVDNFIPELEAILARELDS